MAITEVGSGSQRASNTADNSDTCAVAYPGSVTSGNLLVAGGSWYDPGSTSISQLAVTATRTTGNWTIYGTELSSGDVWGWIAFAVATSSGACTVTADGQGADNYHGFAVTEFTGQHATPFSVDGGGSTGTGNGPATDSITTATANELVLAVTQSDYFGTLTFGPNWTQIGEEENGSAHVIYNFMYTIAGAAGAQTASTTIDQFANWSVTTISLKEATGGQTIAALSGSLNLSGIAAVLRPGSTVWLRHRK